MSDMTADSFETGWQIERIDQADWALERLGEIRRQIEEADEMEKAAIARAKASAERLRIPLQKDAAFFEAHLRLWAEDNRKTLLTGKAKSRKLLHGSVGWRQTGGTLEVKDEATLLQWAKAGGLQIIEAPDLKLIRSIFKTTGEVPPGTDLRPVVDSFYVSTTGED